ncbi:MAG TPA: nitroreductase [Phycisphaerales bacterium]|nr:nitroreductase [Phycisphaerales bacterium]HMP38273.1 nitroreductase [Phycisphaerales bacterium]
MTQPTVAPLSTPPINQPALDLLTRRRSPKLLALTTPAPSDDELATMLGIAARVPDHGQLVPWRFIVIAGSRREDLGQLIGGFFDADHPEADATQRAEARKRLTHAPVVVAVVSSPRRDPTDPRRPHPKIPEREQLLSAGAVCMNLLLAAKACGYGALWLTEWYAYDRRVLDALGLSAHESLAGFIHIGTERDPRDDRTRPRLADIVTAY